VKSLYLPMMVDPHGIHVISTEVKLNLSILQWVFSETSPSVPRNIHHITMPSDYFSHRPITIMPQTSLHFSYSLHTVENYHLCIPVQFCAIDIFELAFGAIACEVPIIHVFRAIFKIYPEYSQ
jgi:hypothetical protein